MKNRILILIILATNILYAQTFPITKTLDWDDNPAGDNVINYVVTADTVQVGQPTVSQFTITINNGGPHTYCVTAVNAIGSSGQTCITAGVPGNPKNIRIL